MSRHTGVLLLALGCAPEAPSWGTAVGNPSGLDVSVATQAGCAWTVQQVDAWIDVSGMSTGTGSGSTRISVERNRNKADRTGTIRIAGQPFVVSQQGK